MDKFKVNAKLKFCMKRKKYIYNFYNDHKDKYTKVKYSSYFIALAVYKLIIPQFLIIIIEHLGGSTISVLQNLRS